MKKIAALLLLLPALFRVVGQEQSDQVLIPIHTAVVKEVIPNPMYTYIHVVEDTLERWIAVPRATVSAGDTCYFFDGVEMRNFTSKEMKRTFPVVWFMDQVSPTPQGLLEKKVNQHGQAARPVVMKQQIAVDPAEGGVTIAELMEHRDRFGGQLVRIRGQVVKYNERIMGRNWIHLQDGTSFGKEFDLTVTLSASLKVGDVVTVEGKISLDRDFGSGYAYQVLMEDALVIEK